VGVWGGGGREREREREIERDRERESVCVCICACVCLCVCVRKRERERDTRIEGVAPGGSSAWCDDTLNVTKGALNGKGRIAALLPAKSP
jgi:hypothetical protein